MRGLLCATTLMVGAAYVVPAHALVFDLTVDGCAKGCGTGSTVFGTIDVEQGDTDFIVRVTETLYEGFQFEKSGAGRALQFSLSDSPTITISDVTSNFARGASNVYADTNASTFGLFGYSIVCSGCGDAGSEPLFGGSLSFTITGRRSGPTISPASFVANAAGYYFSSNIVGIKGHHGNVAADHVTVPEPASMVLLGAGLVSFGLVRRRTA